MSGLDQAAQDTSSAAEKANGTLRITISAVAAELLITPHLAEFRRKHPELKVSVSINERLVDIVEERFDAGIRRADMLQGDMVSECLSPDIQMLAVASPGYIDVRRRPETPRDLKQHECIRICSKTRGNVRPWRFTREEEVDLKVDGGLVTDTPTLALAAAVNCIGIARLASDYLEPHLRSGKLVPLLTEWAIPRPGFHIYHARQRYVPTGVHLLTKFLRSKCGLVE